MKFNRVAILVISLIYQRAAVAQTDPALTLEQASNNLESQTEASLVVEEITETALIDFDTLEAFTQSPENALEPLPAKLLETPANLTEDSLQSVGPLSPDLSTLLNMTKELADIVGEPFNMDMANVTEEVPGGKRGELTTTNVASAAAEGNQGKLAVANVTAVMGGNPREELASEMDSQFNSTHLGTPLTGESIDLLANHTDKDFSHDTINHYPTNTTAEVYHLPAEEVEQIPVNQTEEVVHLRDEIIHQLVNLTENEVVFEHTHSISRDDLTDDLRTWQPPEYFVKHFPYYLSGYDYEDRPIWVAEFGKYDMMKLVEMGPKVLADFEKYAAQAARIVTDSHKWKNPDVDTISVIIDFDGLRLTQYAQIPTLNFVLKLARDYAKILEQHLGLVVVVNVNYVTQTLINFVRPIFATIFRIVEFHGTDKSRWLPHLLRHFPRESLPEWYGGNKSWVPVKILG